MTIGIYLLYWESCKEVYIGQSVNIESRYKSHIRSLKHGKHRNIHVQNKFNLNGVPSIRILEVSNTELLNSKEVLWFNKFEHTLNIAVPGNSSFGTEAVGAKYSRIQILRAFSMLSSGDGWTEYSKIYSRTGVIEPVISSIKTGASHTWLKEEYPERYDIMFEKVPDYNLRHRKVLKGILKSKCGELYEIYNCSDFARLVLGNVALNSHVNAVLNNKRKSVKGFTKIN